METTPGRACSTARTTGLRRASEVVGAGGSPAREEQQRDAEQGGRQAAHGGLPDGYLLWTTRGGRREFPGATGPGARALARRPRTPCNGRSRSGAPAARLRRLRPVIDIFEEIAEMRAEGERGALCTVVSTTGSTPGKETMRMLVRESGAVLGLGRRRLRRGRRAWPPPGRCLETEAPRRLTFKLTEEATGQTGLLCGGVIEIFVEPITAPHAILFGGRSRQPVALRHRRRRRLAGDGRRRPRGLRHGRALPRRRSDASPARASRRSSATCGCRRPPRASS